MTTTPTKTNLYNVDEVRQQARQFVADPTSPRMFEEILEDEEEHEERSSRSFGSCRLQK
ncbi:MAG TPA: hypothetical protein V6D26_31795 [Stenomitos sp.]